MIMSTQVLEKQRLPPSSPQGGRLNTKHQLYYQVYKKKKKILGIAYIPPNSTINEAVRPGPANSPQLDVFLSDVLKSLYKDQIWPDEKTVKV